MPKYDYILFDFDGTISQSAEGVRYSLERTIEKMGKPMPDLSDYLKYLGPPLVNTMKNICGFSEEECEKGADIYREFYKTAGVTNNCLYDGMAEVLKKLSASSAKLAVCSSKYEKFVKEACDYLNITRYFDAVCGSSKDGSRKEKADLIPYALQRLGAGKNCRAVLIGDTYFDAQGALQTGTDFIGAEYGYGKKEPMEQYGARAFVKSPSEIIGLVL